MRLCRVLLDFFAQTVDVHGDRDIIAHRLKPPYQLVQILASEYLIWVPGEKQQQLIFLVCQCQRLPAHACRVGFSVDADGASSEYGAFGGLRPEPPVLGQVRFHTGDKHGGGEGLFNIIVRTETETAYFVHILCARRDHEYRNVQLFAQPPAHGEAVKPRQHEVKEYEVVPAGQRFFQSAHAVSGYVGLHAVKLKIVALDLRDFPVVLYYKYPARVLPSPFIRVTLMHSPPSVPRHASALPPICSAALLTMASPSPLPSAPRLRAGSVR